MMTNGAWAALSSMHSCGSDLALAVSPSGNHGYSPSGEPVYVGGNGSKVHEQSVMLPRR
jgi:hypothetical protein